MNLNLNDEFGEDTPNSKKGWSNIDNYISN